MTKEQLEVYLPIYMDCMTNNHRMITALKKAHDGHELVASLAAAMALVAEKISPYKEDIRMIAYSKWEADAIIGIIDTLIEDPAFKDFLAKSGEETTF